MLKFNESLLVTSTHHKIDQEEDFFVQPIRIRTVGPWVDPGLIMAVNGILHEFVEEVESVLPTNNLSSVYDDLSLAALLRSFTYKLDGTTIVVVSGAITLTVSLGGGKYTDVGFTAVRRVLPEVGDGRVFFLYDTGQEKPSLDWYDLSSHYSMVCARRKVTSNLAFSGDKWQETLRAWLEACQSVVVPTA